MTTKLFTFIVLLTITAVSADYASCAKNCRSQPAGYARQTCEGTCYTSNLDYKPYDTDNTDDSVSTCKRKCENVILPQRNFCRDTCESASGGGGVDTGTIVCIFVGVGLGVGGLVFCVKQCGSEEEDTKKKPLLGENQV